MFKSYTKTTKTDIRPYVEGEKLPASVGMADELRGEGSPKKGDMVCRDSDNHDDLWLISQDYFKSNYVEG